mmetsp:Transcript_58786/g.127614  ORF Transcript_58786/g.127614 Transcript_58786/m.127614 type:complete len:122 (+) Transcript_58786:967-1332(+)
MGYNVTKGLEEQINKLDDLENIPEEDEEEDEVDWWELSLIILKQTHPFGIVFFNNRFCPKHIRLSFVFFELMMLLLISLVVLKQFGGDKLTISNADWMLDSHIFDWTALGFLVVLITEAIM